MVTISTSYKSKQFLWLVFKLIVLILLGYFIYDTLANNSEISWEEFQQTLKNSAVSNPLIILILLGFTLLNWALEIFKWRLLSSTIKPTSFLEAATQSLASHAFSLITPNRIGEYGAKALYYEKSERKNIVVLNLIGNFHQLLVTLLIGAIAVMIEHLVTKNLKINVLHELIYDIIIAIGMISLIMNHTNWLDKPRERIYARFNFVTKKLNRKISLVSFIRYLIFSHQFYFLTTQFGMNSGYFETMSAIAVLYLLSSIIPMLSVFDFVVKGSVAVFVFSYLGESPLVVLTITTIMWLLNFVLPAIVGSYFMIKFKPLTA